MGVGIDEAGKDQPLGVIQHLSRGVALVKLRRGPHRDNLGALKGHRPGREHLAVRVHGQHPGPLDNQGNRFRPWMGNLLLHSWPHFLLVPAPGAAGPVGSGWRMAAWKRGVVPGGIFRRKVPGARESPLIQGLRSLMTL